MERVQIASMSAFLTPLNETGVPNE